MTQIDREFLHQQCGIVVHSTVVVGEKGQVVIPKTARETLKINPGDMLLCALKGKLAFGLLKEEALDRLPKCSEQEIRFHTSVTVGDRGQVVIPKIIRDTIGIRPGDMLMSVVKFGAIVGMVKVEDIDRMMEYLKNEISDSKVSSR